MLRKLLVLVPIVAALNITPAFAQAIIIFAVPTDWRLENYPGSNITLWNTGSNCASGKLSFPSTATEADKNRLFSMIMLAKATSRPAGIYYINTNGNCVIQSFYLQGNK
ncbi:MAG TPA: hypothetical protein V6D15_11485 [Oculatellaceae cyanobacterium]|jgi:hypothetical protein